MGIECKSFKVCRQLCFFSLLFERVHLLADRGCRRGGREDPAAAGCNAQTAHWEGHEQCRGAAEGRAGVARDADRGDDDGPIAGGAGRSVAARAGALPQSGGQRTDRASAAGDDAHTRPCSFAGDVH